MSEKYNGWTNWETWTVNMYYLDGYQEYIRDQVEESNPIVSQADLADMFKDYVEEYEEEMHNTHDLGLASEFYRAGIQRVNWYELSDHILDTQMEAVVDLVTDLASYSDNWDEFDQNLNSKLTEKQWEALPESLPHWLDEISDLDGHTPQELADMWDEEIEAVIGEPA